MHTKISGSGLFNYLKAEGAVFQQQSASYRRIGNDEKTSAAAKEAPCALAGWTRVGSAISTETALKPH